MRTVDDNSDLAQIAQTIACTEAEGPGKRFAVWFQGCPLRCPECCNPEMLPFSGGESISVAGLVTRILDAKDHYGVEGITLLGGEPFAHAEPAAELARQIQDARLSVMVFTGFLLEKLQRDPDPAVQLLLKHTDLLVDGPFLRDQPDMERRWIGSKNQRVHFLTDRYRAEDDCWTQPNTLEIRWRGTELSINGFPAKQAAGLWKRPTRDQPSAG